MVFLTVPETEIKFRAILRLGNSPLNLGPILFKASMFRKCFLFSLQVSNEVIVAASDWSVVVILQLCFLFPGHTEYHMNAPGAFGWMLETVFYAEETV